MAQTKRLPDAELEVMQTIWTLTPPVTAARYSITRAATGK